MKTLLANRLAPLTFAWGFLDVPLPATSKAFEDWRRSLFSAVATEQVHAPLEESLLKLKPLTSPPRKELLLATPSRWTAYFDNGLNGGDPVSSIGHLCTVLKCRGVAVSCIPNTITSKSSDAEGIYGAVSFELFSPEPKEFLNYERSIAVTNDGGVWRFTADGTIQSYEQTEKYKLRKIEDRFTADMLEEYCKALGIRLFDPTFYGPSGHLLTFAIR